MRESLAGVALIRREEPQGPVLLAQWNAKWGAFHFVSGHKEPSESFRECVTREVAEELELHEGGDFIVAGQALVQLEYAAWSDSAGEQTRYVVAIFEVALRGALALGKVNRNADNRWLTEAEIRQGKCSDGRRVSPTAALLLSRLPAPRPEPE